MELILHFLVWFAFLGAKSPPPPPPPPKQLPVQPANPAALTAAEDLSEAPPPNPLPPARGCREATAGTFYERLPGRVDGGQVHGVGGIARLRERWGEALIVIVGGNFAEASFKGMRLRNICFIGTNFERSDWRDAETSGVGFIHASLTGAWLDRTRMRGLVLDTVNLDGVTAHGADWRGGVLRGGPLGSLERVRLDGADLRGFRFACGGGMETACLTSWGEVSLRGADLRDARVDTLRADADWTGARLAGTRINLRQLTELAPAKRLGPLILREGATEARISPAEFAALQPFVHRLDQRPQERRSPTQLALRPGEAALFVEPQVRFAPTFQATPLYRRLVPLLASDPRSRVLVTGRGGGRIDAAGDAVGSANHLCDVSGKGLRFDAATGWYSGPYQPQHDEPRAWRNRPMQVLRFDGERAEVYQPHYRDDPRLSGYTMCGARASFGDMLRLPLSSAEARRWYKVQPRQ